MSGTFSARVKRAWNENQLFSALLELTYACNLNCAFCYNDLTLEGERLTKDDYFALLDDLARMGVMNLTLSGGEPLAHPDFFAIGAEARRLGFAIRIKSNGHALRRDVALRIREEIDPLVIDVSLHGATAETHDRQTRVPGSFDRLQRNLRTMLDLGLRVRVNTTLTRWNEGELRNMFELTDALGLPLQVDDEVKPRDDGDREPLDLSASPEGQRTWAALRAERAAVRDPASISPEGATEQAALRRSLKDGVEKHCGAGASTVSIDPFGNVLPCVQWRRPVGNVRMRRVSEIWGGSPEIDDVRRITRTV
ncbi:MAG: radical SAM protein [Myxococcales bacterium]|nr:radical SAM protein [Myxococcales bacterium]